jgi:hypothetical protein
MKRFMLRERESTIGLAVSGNDVAGCPACQQSGAFGQPRPGCDSLIDALESPPSKGPTKDIC